MEAHRHMSIRAPRPNAGSAAPPLSGAPDLGESSGIPPPTRGDGQYDHQIPPCLYLPMVK